MLELYAGLPKGVLVGLATFLGGAFGSFFNVVAWRLPQGMSLSRPASHCPQCGTPIPWYRNLPVATWLLQRGRCAVCRCGIPVRYVLVEAACAGLGAMWCLGAIDGLWGDPSLAAGWIAFALAGVPIALIDWDTFEIPDGLVVVAGCLGLGARLAFSEDPLEALPGILRDALLACGALYALSFGARVGLGWLGGAARALLHRGAEGRRKHRILFGVVLRWARFDADVEALGLGDVSLALAAGAALGFPSIVLGLPIAAMLGVIAHLLRPGDRARQQAHQAGLDPQALPFGPFLLAGFLIASAALASGRLPIP